jgi:hypothetical protein
MIGCQNLQSYIDIAKDKGISKEYISVLTKWTREQTIHSQFETRAHIAATYKSAEFIDGYQKEHVRIYQHDPTGNNDRKQAPLHIDNDYTEFLFYAYIPDKEANDFETQRSIWKVYLIDGSGQRVDPVEIRKISKITPVMEAFYPYINKYYGNFYQLKFPKKVDTQNSMVKADNKTLRVVFTSVLGKIELTWN